MNWMNYRKLVNDVKKTERCNDKNKRLRSFSKLFFQLDFISQRWAALDIWMVEWQNSQAKTFII